MKAIILAAGRSTRLYPLTRFTPKCLLDVDNKTILDYLIEGMTTHGVTEIVIVVGCHKAKIIKFIKKFYPQVKVKYILNPRYRKTNAIYSLWLARKEFLNEKSVLFTH